MARLSMDSRATPDTTATGREKVDVYSRRKLNSKFRRIKKRPRCFRKSATSQVEVRVIGKDKNGAPWLNPTMRCAAAYFRSVCL
jgi:hypothetical protein